MAAETAQQFEALERQAQRLMGVFTRAGYEAVAPAIIQPAGPVPRRASARALRARTYVFTDPDGEELCLRPDLTVPTCRLHLARYPAGTAPGALLLQRPRLPLSAGRRRRAHPREFRQAGIEVLRRRRPRAGRRRRARAHRRGAARGRPGADPCCASATSALFTALLDAPSMPERWRRRLRHQFWRPEAFRAELERLTVEPAPRRAGCRASCSLNSIRDDPQEAAEIVGALPGGAGDGADRHALPARDRRRLLAVAADLARDAAAAGDRGVDRERYVAITRPAPDACRKIEALVAEYKLDLRPASTASDRRLAMLANAGIDTAKCSVLRRVRPQPRVLHGLRVRGARPASRAHEPGGRRRPLRQPAGGPSARPTEVPAVGSCHPHRAAAGRRRGSRRMTTIPTAGDKQRNRQARVRRSLQGPADGADAELLAGGRSDVYAKPAPRAATGARSPSIPDVEVNFVSSSEIAQLLKTGIGASGHHRRGPDPRDHRRCRQRVAFLQPLGFGLADVVVAVPACWIDVRRMADLEEMSAWPSAACTGGGCASPPST